MIRRKTKSEQPQIRRRLSTVYYPNIFQTIMRTICFKQILYTALILNIAMAIETDVDHGNCENATSDERLSIAIIEPIHYKLFFKLNMESENYDGESDIVIKIHKPVKRLSLHCFGPYIYTSSISLKSITEASNKSIQHTRYASYRVCTKTQRFDILYDDLISPGLYELHIHFYGVYNKNENIIRYQYMRYTETEATRRWFLGILSTSNRARTLFPCWDEPEIHMNYEIIIEHPEQYNVISNMPVEKLINKSDGTSLTYFLISKPIASSQVAIIMVDDMTHSYLGDDLYWHQRNIVKNANITLEIRNTKELFKNYLGVHYGIMENDHIVFPKTKDLFKNYARVHYGIMETDHIVIPNFPSQIRGSLGVIIYREESFKYDNATDFPGRKMYIYKVVGDSLAREVLVQIISPSYFWLIKILASFLSYFVIFQYERDSSIMDLSIVQTMQGALYYDVDFQMAPVSQNKFVHPIDEIDAIHYSRLYYNKGAAIMRMLFYSLEVPEYVYKESIRKCSEECEDTSDPINGFWAIVQSSLTNNEKLLYNITEIMDTWMTKRHFPELKVDRDYNSGLATLSAYNFNETNWKTPITYLKISHFTSMNVTSKILFDCSYDIYISKLDNNDFIIVNMKYTGYYRVNYDDRNWDKICTYLNFHNYTQINVLNRAQLIDDAYYFVINNKLQISVFIRLFRYLRREKHYVAWYPMFNILIYMSKFFEFPESNLFKSYMFEILDSLLAKIGYSEYIEEDDMTKALRLLGIKWACKFDHALCRKNAPTVLNSVVKDSSKILPWWKELVYCAGMKGADLLVWHQFLDKNSGNYTQEHLTYLACTENEHALLAYLEFLWKLKYKELIVPYHDDTDAEISYEIIMAAYRSFVKKHARKMPVLIHILENYNNLSSTILGSKSPVAVIGVTIMELYSEDNFDEVSTFVKSTRYLTEKEKNEILIFVKQRKIQLQKLSHYFRNFYIFQMKMCTICFKQILYTALVLNIAMAIKTDVDHGNCENATSDERLSIAIIEPIHYKLFLKLNMESENYNGESDIVIKIHKPTKRLSLHCFGPYIYTSSISLKSITEALNPSTRYASYRVCTKTQRFDILYDDLISPGLYELHIHFYGIYNKNENIIRYQYIRYTETEATKRWFLGILSTSNRARTLFPCWDEPEIHMYYEIIIEHPEQYKVISNMPVEKLINKSDDTSLTYFHISKPIASSQVAIIMVDDMTHSNLGDDLYWYQRNIVKNTNIMLEIRDTKELFKNYLGVYYRIIESDHIVIPNFPSQIIGSLGVIIYREESFKYDYATDFPGRKMYIYKIIGDSLAREVLVQIICPSYFWLIKILASFLSYFAIFQYERDSSIMDLSIVQTMQGALNYDVDFQMAPVSQNKFMHSIDEIDAIHYSRPYYNKGAAIMRMLFYSLEAPEYVYKESIRKCAEECDNTTDSMSGLWAIVQSSLTNNEKLLYNITEIMDTWMTKRHFPELKVDCDYYGLAILSAYNCNKTKWKTPITYLKMSNFTSMYVRSKMILFDCSYDIYIRELDINDFVIINMNQTGYYRVNYDYQNWDKICTYLNFHNYTQINVLNRAQLIDDAYYFVINNKLHSSVFVRLIRYLKRELHYVAWYPMFNILMYMSKYFELPESERFKSYVLEILDGLLEKVGYSENIEEDDMIKSLRLLGLKWACKFGHKSCRKSATIILIFYLEDSSKIRPWWKEWIYCAGLMEADLQVWRQFLDKNSGNYTQEHLTYLTCAEYEHVLIAYLEFLWNLKYEELMISNHDGADLEMSYDIIMAAYRSFVKKHARKNDVLMHILRNYNKLPSTILGSKSPVAVLGVTIMELYSADNFDVVTAFAKSTRYLTEKEKNEIEIFVKQRKIQLEKISYYFRKFGKE
ncbi:uncharacterized protein LOC116851946 [Odontomachus brunneus]|uniref:uncharacterized protein LOC116851946 n=1 Tax=Odontomachus brunneus TaxID=486640 RepID=UPI0013F19B2E|nr:uncharacterized protein LOC116851946 [Odontomachus brunneus]